MKTIFAITTLMLATISCSKNTPPHTEWPPITTEALPWTRWWWPGSDVDKDGLRYNLEAMSQAGIGGVEITPIYGVQGREAHYIDYLSADWMKMLAFTEAEAKRLGMKVDMNNGTGWPFGGPEVNIEDAATKAIFQEYQLNAGQGLQEKIVVQDPKQKDLAHLSKVMAYKADGSVMDITDKVNNDGTLNFTAAEDAKLIALFMGKTLQQVKRAAPGGKGYVLNHFDKNAVRRYLEKFDKAFSESNTPFPNSFFNDSYEVYGADWTPGLLEQFEQRRGYKLQDYFPELLNNGEDELTARIMCDYRETIGELLKENFTQNWTEWAHKHKVKTRNQAHGSPANLIDLYAAVDIPECESFGISDFNIPGLRKDSIRKKNDGDPTTLKYASSAAHIAGKKHTSSETFTWLTEHFRTSLSQCKPEVDQMFTSGVNHVYFHGSTYSPEDADWPGWKFYASVDMSPTNSIWRDAPAFFKYITRAQSFLQMGKPDNDFLYYLPIYDIWEEQKGNYFTTFAIHGMRERLPEFCEGVEEVMSLGYDLDYISDHFIETSTVVEGGILKTEGGTSYKALILPATKLIPLSTMTKINELAQAGATVIFTEDYPKDVPGLSNLEERRNKFKSLLKQLPKVECFDKVSVNKFGKGTIITGNRYKDILSKTNVKNESFVSKFGGSLVRRSNPDGYHYFMTMLKNKSVDAWVALGTKAESAMFFDPMTGRKGQAKLRNNKGRSEVYMQLKPGESVILKTFDSHISINEQWAYYRSGGKEIDLTSTGNWDLGFVDSKPTISRNFSMPKPIFWTELDDDKLKVNMGTGCYSTSFHFKKKPDNEYLLCLEQIGESAKVAINGTYAGTLFAVPFETNITKLLKNGENNIEIEVTNLPANRIADLDRRGVKWRIFHEINFVNIAYKKTLFDNWGITPSGLSGQVIIKEVRKL